MRQNRHSSVSFARSATSWAVTKDGRRIRAEVLGPTPPRESRVPALEPPKPAVAVRRCPLCDSALREDAIVEFRAGPFYTKTCRDCAAVMTGGLKLMLRLLGK